MVMSLVKGPTMLDDLASHPWRLRAHARTLALLHLRLHEIDAPPWLSKVGEHPGDSILHLDFHPANVMMSPTGPVVIDWTNARAGPTWLDTSHTEVLLRTGEAPGNALVRAVTTAGRVEFVRAYRQTYGKVDAAVARLDTAARRFLDDPNITSLERKRAEALTVERG